MDYVPSSRHKGPDLGLFFHELVGNETFPKQMFCVIGGSIGFLLFVVTYPIIALLVKISSGGPVLRKDTRLGRHGTAFTCYTYNIFNEEGEIARGLIAKFLYKFRLYRLPHFLNLVRGEMDLVGPAPLESPVGDRLNDELTDFYKRFAVKPGIIKIRNGTESFQGTHAFEDWESLLEKELYYVAKPTLKKDMRVILSKFGAEQMNGTIKRT
ncbi:MAG: sugar transferase [Balneolaceae bacterium]|nr:sugar transferase [Balneolaceae bacterium]